MFIVKKLFIVFVLFCTSFAVSGYKRPDVYVIDAEKNAYLHNNLGLKAFADHNYYDAILEFNMAIKLNPNTQATAIYYNNLGETYMLLKVYNYAQQSFENSLRQYNLNFQYYINLVKSISAQNLTKSKIDKYERLSEKTSTNMIILGLLYIENGDNRRGIIKLDEFCMKEPDLLITPAVKNYIKSILESN